MENIYDIYKSFSYEKLVECLNNSKSKDEEHFYLKLIEFHVEHNKNNRVD